MNRKLVLCALLFTSACYSMQDEEDGVNREALDQLEHLIMGEIGEHLEQRQEPSPAQLENGQGQRALYAHARGRSAARKDIAVARTTHRKNTSNMARIASLISTQNKLIREQTSAIVKDTKKSFELHVGRLGVKVLFNTIYASAIIYFWIRSIQCRK